MDHIWLIIWPKYVFIWALYECYMDLIWSHLAISKPCNCECTEIIYGYYMENMGNMDTIWILYGKIWVIHGFGRIPGIGHIWN